MYRKIIMPKLKIRGIFLLHTHTYMHYIYIYFRQIDI